MTSKSPKRTKAKRRAPKSHREQEKGTYTNKENSGFTFLDPHKYVTFKYVECFSTSVASSGGSIQTMNINSLFDPNRTGSGHQPYGFDAMAALYNRYRVLETRWKVTFGTQTGTYKYVVTPVNSLIQASVSDQATYQTASEMPLAVNGVQGGGGAPTAVVKGKVKLWELNGVPKLEYLGDDRFEAAVGSSPTEIMTLAIGTFNDTASSITVSFTVELEFHADLHDPITLSTSFEQYKKAQMMKNLLQSK